MFIFKSFWRTILPTHYMKIHKTIHAYIGPIWFHLVGVILEGRKWKERKYRLGFYLEEKCEGKLVGHEYFLHGPTKYNLPKWERKGKKTYHVFWTEISTSKTFLFFPLLSISSFIFCLFLLLLNYFSALSFVCSYPFFSHLFIYLFIFFYICFFSSFVLRYSVCVKCPSIHNWIEQIL